MVNFWEGLGDIWKIATEFPAGMARQAMAAGATLVVTWVKLTRNVKFPSKGKKQSSLVSSGGHFEVALPRGLISLRRETDPPFLFYKYGFWINSLYVLLYLFSKVIPWIKLINKSFIKKLMLRYENNFFRNITYI